MISDPNTHSIVYTRICVPCVYTRERGGRKEGGRV